MQTDQDLCEQINNFLPTVIEIVIVSVSAANLICLGHSVHCLYMPVLI